MYLHYERYFTFVGAYLQSQLSSGGQDECLGLIQGRINPLEDGNDKGGGLPCT